MPQQQESRPARRSRRSVKRDAVPDLADTPILERLDGPPPPAPGPSETLHDKARRQLIAQPGQWMVLNPRVKLSETSARRLARSYQRARPARLDPTAGGRFAARPFIRDDTWHVAACYQTEPAASRGA